MTGLCFISKNEKPWFVVQPLFYTDNSCAIFIVNGDC
jgi:hypothetical protein